MKKLPKLTQRQRDGKAFGAFHVLVKNKPINLNTNDLEVARKRRPEALRGARKWPRVWLAVPKSSQGDATEGTARAIDAIAALGDIAPPNESAPPPIDLPPPPGAASSSSAGAPGASEPVIDPEPVSAESWAADVAGAAQSAQSEAQPEPAQSFKLTDLPFFDALLVTGSKIAVGAQVRLQAWAMRLVGDVEAGRVGPPPKIAEPDSPETMSAFMKVASARWQPDDPREPGRAAYEKTLLAIIPAELPVPAWVKWFEAPVVTAVHTVPVQWAGAVPIKRDAAGNEVQPEVPEEAPPGERAAA